MSDIYSTLNPQQQEAVYHTEGPLLILAGAGSGKTRVLTHRIAYLIDKKGINPWNILAITFTNKAASEMRERVDKIVGFGSESVWVSTFHSTCVRILRRYIDRLGYDTRFAIYDTEDQKTLMKEVCRKLNIDTKKTKERSLLAQISHAKDELITPDEMELNAGGDFVRKKVAEVNSPLIRPCGATFPQGERLKIYFYIVSGAFTLNIVRMLWMTPRTARQSAMRPC